VIIAKNKHDAVQITGDGVLLSGLNITQPSQDAQGLWIESNNNQIIGNQITGNFIGCTLYYSRNNTLRLNEFSENHMRGLQLHAGNNNTIVNNTFSGNQFYEGILIAQESEDNYIAHNEICLNGRAGISSYDLDNNIFEFNSIHHNRYGIAMDLFRPQTTVIRWNEFFNNTEYGFRTSNMFEVNVTDNWWGHQSGPYHPENNTEGKGDNVTDNVVFHTMADTALRGTENALCG